MKNSEISIDSLSLDIYKGNIKDLLKNCDVQELISMLQLNHRARKAALDTILDIVGNGEGKDVINYGFLPIALDILQDTAIGDRGKICDVLLRLSLHGYSQELIENDIIPILINSILDSDNLVRQRSGLLLDFIVTKGGIHDVIKLGGIQILLDCMEDNSYEHANSVSSVIATIIENGKGDALIQSGGVSRIVKILDPNTQIAVVTDEQKSAAIYILLHLVKAGHMNQLIKHDAIPLIVDLLNTTNIEFAATWAVLEIVLNGGIGIIQKLNVWKPLVENYFDTNDLLIRVYSIIALIVLNNPDKIEEIKHKMFNTKNISTLERDLDPYISSVPQIVG